MKHKEIECPHINECQQKIRRNDTYLCRGELGDWDQEDCFKYNDNGLEAARYPDSKPVKMPCQWEKVTAT